MTAKSSEITTLQQLKARLVPGTKIRQTYSWYSGTCDQILEISDTQTNGVWFAPTQPGGKRSWLEFPKRSQIQFFPDGFASLMGPGDLRIASKYEWLPEQGIESSPC